MIRGDEICQQLNKSPLSLSAGCAHIQTSSDYDNIDMQLFCCHFLSEQPGFSINITCCKEHMCGAQIIIYHLQDSWKITDIIAVIGAASS